VSNTIKRSYRSLHASKIYFTQKKVKKHVDNFNFFAAFFITILKYGTLPTLKANLKKRCASANAMKICNKNYNYIMPYDLLHSINNQAQPDQILKYKLAQMLFELYREKIPTQKCIALNDEQTFTSH
jgi:hypothetical protein